MRLGFFGCCFFFLTEPEKSRRIANLGEKGDEGMHLGHKKYAC